MLMNDLLQYQAGKETTWGTGVAATSKLMGIESLDLEPLVEAEVLEDVRASQAPGHNAVINRIEGGAPFSSQLLYQDIVYWLESLGGVVTPTGAGPYVYAGEAPVTASAITPRRMTLYKGDSTDAYRMLGSIVSELTIKGENNGKLMVDGKLLGKQVTSGASLAALNDRTVDVAMGDHVSLFYDAWGGTIGSTPLNNAGFSFELSIKTNRTLRTYLGSLTPGNFNDPKWKGSSLKLTVEFNSTTKSYLNNLLAGSLEQAQIRIKAQKSASRIAQFDFAGNLKGAPKVYGLKDGLPILELEYDGQYNPTLANWWKWSVTNDLSAMP